METVNINIELDRELLASWNHVLQISPGRKVILNKIGRDQMDMHFANALSPHHQWFDPETIFMVQSMNVPEIQKDQRLKQSGYKEGDLRFGHVNLIGTYKNMTIHLQINIAGVEPVERHCVERCQYVIGWRNADAGCYTYLGGGHARHPSFTVDIMGAYFFSTATSALEYSHQCADLKDQVIEIIEVISKSNVVIVADPKLTELNNI